MKAERLKRLKPKVSFGEAEDVADPEGFVGVGTATELVGPIKDWNEVYWSVSDSKSQLFSSSLAPVTSFRDFSFCDDFPQETPRAG